MSRPWRRATVSLNGAILSRSRGTSCNDTFTLSDMVAPHYTVCVCVEGEREGGREGGRERERERERVCVCVLLCFIAIRRRGDYTNMVRTCQACFIVNEQLLLY